MRHREGLHTHLVFIRVRKPLMLSPQQFSLNCQPVSMEVDPFLSQEMHAKSCKIIPLPLQFSERYSPLQGLHLFFGCNLNTECQVTERSVCSECRNISQAFCVAQWPTQANKRTVAIHGYITIPEISQWTTASFSNHPCLCLSHSTAEYHAFHSAAIYAMLQKDTRKYWKRYNYSLLYCSYGHTQSYL